MIEFDVHKNTGIGPEKSEAEQRASRQALFRLLVRYHPDTLASQGCPSYFGYECTNLINQHGGLK